MAPAAASFPRCGSRCCGYATDRVADRWAPTRERPRRGARHRPAWHRREPAARGRRRRCGSGMGGSRTGSIATVSGRPVTTRVRYRHHRSKPGSVKWPAARQRRVRPYLMGLGGSSLARCGNRRATERRSCLWSGGSRPDATTASRMRTGPARPHRSGQSTLGAQHDATVTEIKIPERRAVWRVVGQGRGVLSGGREDEGHPQGRDASRPPVRAFVCRRRSVHVLDRRSPLAHAHPLIGTSMIVGWSRVRAVRTADSRASGESARTPGMP